MGTGRLQGKVVVAFGSGQGIGRGCALAMASGGASVIAAHGSVAPGDAVVMSGAL